MGGAAVLKMGWGRFAIVSLWVKKQVWGGGDVSSSNVAPAIKSCSERRPPNKKLSKGGKLTVRPPARRHGSIQIPQELPPSNQPERDRQSPAGA